MLWKMRDRGGVRFAQKRDNCWVAFLLGGVTRRGTILESTSHACVHVCNATDGVRVRSGEVHAEDSHISNEPGWK